MTKKNKTIIFSTIILAAGIIAVIVASNIKPQKEIEYMHASWEYNYEDIKEISQASDLIALVKVNNIEECTIDSGIPFTKFSVNITSSIYNPDNINDFIINMTGGETEDKIIEIEDDPLLETGDEFLAFCKKSEDGIYYILSGSQGRLIYSNGKLNSLNAIDKRIAEANQFSNITVKNADAEKTINEIREYVANKNTDKVDLKQ